MNRADEPCVCVLDTLGGAPRAMSLAQAVSQAGRPEGAMGQPRDLPLLTTALRERGAAAVCVIGVHAEGDAADRSCQWLDAVHARGWVSSNAAAEVGPFLAAWQTRLAEGHVPADAALLAWDPLPRLSWDDRPLSRHTVPKARTAAAPLGLYAIVDTAPALRQVIEAGVRTVQLRVKRPADADAAWAQALRSAVRDSVAVAADLGALLFINDHWQLAAELGGAAVHLGQEDLLALNPDGHAELLASGLDLGVSSHAVWELCRARGLAPRYIACGPVWATTTKAMPWRPQGLDNLAWWCRSAGAPVVAIGGILAREQVRQAAAAGASGVCVLRGLGDDPKRTVGPLQQAFAHGREEAQSRKEAQGRGGEPAARLHPTLGTAP